MDTARNLYAQFLRILMQKSLITPDDYEVYQQICPLFDPVYVFYDEAMPLFGRFLFLTAAALDCGILQPTV